MMAVSEDRPVTFKTKALGLLLGMAMLSCFSAALGVIGAVLFDPDIKHPVNWRTWLFLAVFLGAGAVALWGLVQIKPWGDRSEPVSPATQRTNRLFTWSGLVAVPGTLVLVLSTSSKEHPFGLFSNSPVAVWIALFAIAGWLLGMAIGWWWYFSADEHERDAYDIASVAGAGFFTVVAPVWWVAARAGLAPPPDAMILWLVTMGVITIGWVWRRSR
jgi:hypothetical protein